MKFLEREIRNGRDGEFFYLRGFEGGGIVNEKDLV